MQREHSVGVRTLAETTALITGGSSGIGFESAAQLAEAGVPSIAINGRDHGRGETAIRMLRARAPGTDFRFYSADVTQAMEATDLVRKVEADFGRCDFLVTAAGGNHSPELFHRTPIEDLQTLITDYVMGALYCAHAALPGMSERRGGAIVVIASDAAKVPTPGESVIGAAMAALTMFTRTLAMEARRSGVRVNCLTPSLVEGTRTYDRVMSADFSRKLFEKASRMAWLGVASPADQAAMVVQMARPEMARMTGQIISINGGISAG